MQFILQLNVFLYKGEKKLFSNIDFFLPQVTVLLPGGQNMNTANLHVLSNVADAPQAILEPVTQVRERAGLQSVSNRLANIFIAEMTGCWRHQEDLDIM